MDDFKDMNDDCEEIYTSGLKRYCKHTARLDCLIQFSKESDSEKHYHELIRLFTPQRGEETDLLGICSSYQRTNKTICCL